MNRNIPVAVNTRQTGIPDPLLISEIFYGVEPARSEALERVAKYVSDRWEPGRLMRAPGARSALLRALAARAADLQVSLTSAKLSAAGVGVRLALAESALYQPVRLNGSWLTKDGKRIKVQPAATSWCYEEPGHSWLVKNLEPRLPGIRWQHYCPARSCAGPASGQIDIALTFQLHWLVTRSRARAEEVLLAEAPKWFATAARAGVVNVGYEHAENAAEIIDAYFRLRAHIEEIDDVRDLSTPKQKELIDAWLRSGAGSIAEAAREAGLEPDAARKLIERLRRRVHMRAG